MAVRNRTVRRPRRLNKHDATLVRRRKKVRWLVAQRARVRDYRRRFSARLDESEQNEHE